MRNILFVLMAVMLLTACTGYSDGERTGVVVKFSHKGLIWKTWEGEMNLGAASQDGNGMMVPTVFKFSVTPDKRDVIETISKAQRSGSRVTLVYSQDFITPPWRGDTNYFIMGAE